jgi:ATP-dependent helicase/DNAse subunit B
MPLTLITGPANAGKAQLVMDAVRGHLADGEEPLLVVPTRADAEHYRRELAAEGALLGARVERFAGLIEEAVRRSGAREPVLDGLVRERVLAAIVARRAPSLLAPGFVRALAAFLAELQVRRVTPARLSEALADWAAADGERAHGGEVGELFEDYHHALKQIARADPEQRAVRALDTLRREPARWGETPVLFYGFDDFVKLQLDAIETLAAAAAVTVSLTYEPGRIAFAGRAGTFQALEPLAAEHRRLPARADHYAPTAREALSHLERSLFEPAPARADPGEAVRLLEGEGERAELELVADEIGALIVNGMAPEEIAVVLRARGAAADLVEEIFSSAEIPHALQRRSSFADTAIGRALIGLLRCSTATGEAGDLLSWLRAPGVLEHAGLADRLEASVRRTGASSAAQARALWEREQWRLESIDHLREAAERGAGALIERAARELGWLFCAPRRGAARVLEGDELNEARALAAGRRSLDELAELARVSPELAPAGALELARVLESVELVSGEHPTPGKVAVLDPLALRARRVRALFVCRLQEGLFPAPAPSRPLLAESERRRLAQASGLRLGEHEDGPAGERYLFYATVSRAQEVLVLSWHSVDEDGLPRTRSLFVDDVCDLFDQSRVEGRACRRPAKQQLPGSELVPRPLKRPRPVAISDERLLGELRGHTWSASSLELWIRCPVRWFVERMLRAEDLQVDPEPLARGGLAHAVLKDTLEGLKSRTGSARLTPERLGLARELLQQALEGNEADFPLSVAPERRPGLRRRLEVDLERYLEHAARSASAERGGDDGVDPTHLEPTHLELPFGFAEEDQDAAGGEVCRDGRGLPALDLGGGLMLRGRIDRVDVGEEGEAVVYDYKSASAWPAARWLGEGTLQVALYMKAVEDLLGLRAVGGFYQPLRGGDLRARGVLDGDSGLELECVRTDRRSHSEVRALLGEAVTAAREAATQAGRGEVQARPQTCAFGGGCSYPTICRCGR